MKTSVEQNKEAIERIAMLKKMSFGFKSTIDDNGILTAYKRRGIELLYIPHSSVKVAKDFDDTI